MSRKRNAAHGKKARDYGSSHGGGMSKHRTSGQSQINRRDRMLACREVNRADADRRAAQGRRTKSYESVGELMAAEARR